ncbi:MAG TPA: CARDB domain-containing protein, partial [Candidatus Polarisedimenticolia bacterium]|nr:CARDB domain-containing protein [Candidatus Polarisedimenticolia bacterium]
QFRIKYGMTSIDDDIVIIDPNVDPPPAPDLQVTAMSGANQSPKEGDRVVLRATVTNAGDGAAGASSTELRLEDGTLIGTASTAALAAGASVEVSVPWDTHGVKGDHVVSATADAASAVAESLEGNNLGRLTVSVKGNKVQNGSFEQPAGNGGSPESWQGSSTNAGSAGYASGGNMSDGTHAVTFTGAGKSCALYGQPTWTSAPIAVTPGEVLTLNADVKSVGLSSAPTIGVIYLGPAGQLISKVTLLTAPLTTSGFAALENVFTVPAGVASVKIVLTGFSATDLKTAGSVTFDDIGLFAN